MGTKTEKNISKNKNRHAAAAIFLQKWEKFPTLACADTSSPPAPHFFFLYFSSGKKSSLINVVLNQKLHASMGN